MITRYGRVSVTPKTNTLSAKLIVVRTGELFGYSFFYLRFPLL